MTPYDDSVSAAAGRPSLALSRDKDWERLVRGVNRLPKLAQERGIEVAVAWGMTELRSVVDLLNIFVPSTPEEAKASHRVHIALTEGFLRVYCRSDRAGFLARRDFLALVERNLVAPTFRLIFARTTADTRTPYQPILGDR